MVNLGNSWDRVLEGEFEKEYYQKLLLARSHGITRDSALMEYENEGPWYYEQVDLGYNYRMTDIQAALILSQLDKLDAFSARRKEIVKDIRKIAEELYIEESEVIEITAKNAKKLFKI